MLGVQSGRATLGVDVDGAGPAVVLLHSGVTDRSAWDDVAAALAPRARVIRYDRRGFGDTTYVSESHNEVGDLLAVMDAVGVERAVLVGNSQGGRIALDAALDEPDRVAALLLIAAAITGAPYPDDPDEVVAIGEAIEAAENRSDLDEVNRLETRVWLDGPLAPEGRIEGEIRDHFRRMNDRALRAADPGDHAVRRPAFPRLGELRVPVTLAVGTLDEPGTIDVHRLAADCLPDGEYASIEGVAHTPQLERPAAVVHLIEALLARVPA